MADNDNSSSVEVPVKSMKGKYDGRRFNGATKARRRLNSNLGRKPNWFKHIGRNDAAKNLDKFDAIASPDQIYKAAWEKGKLELCADMYKQFHDRVHGRPYIAENPQKTQPHPLDNRLQQAIKDLLPPPRPVKLAGDPESNTEKTPVM